MNLQEQGRGQEGISVAQSKGILERGFESAVWTIRKFANDEEAKRDNPYEVVSFKDNILLNSGINELWTILCSTGGTRFDNANAQLGVGDSAVAEVATQTDLQAATNRAFVGMMAGFPSFGTNQRGTWRASFGGAVANYAWNEFVVRNGATALRCLNRRVSAQGTKVVNQVWELSLEISLS